MPKILPITTNPHPILRNKSKKVNPEEIKTDYYQKLCEDMELTMIKKDGVGLAAPQIGKNIRLITVNTKDGVIHAFNPKIAKCSFTKEWDEEGCLSVPNTFGEVKRNKNSTIIYTDKKGQKVELKARGFLARIFQHEIDHLDGILFIDKARNIKKI